MTRVLLAAAAAAVFAAIAPAQVTHTVVTASGLAAPGGGTYSGFNTRGPSLNAFGQVAFFAAVSGGNSGVFRHTTTSGTAIVRNGTTSPTAGYTFEGFSTSNVVAPAINASGDVAFYGSVNDGTDSFGGVFRYTAGTGVTIALQGNAAPGGGTYGDEFGSDDVRLSNGGQVGFFVKVGGTDENPLYGVFRGNGTTTVVVARDGAAAPGGGNYAGVGSPATSSAGLVTLNSYLSTDQEGLFQSNGTATTVIARTGGSAPGGNTYNSPQPLPPAANASGQVAFHSTLSGANTAGVFRFNGTTTTAIALAGTPAPGSGLTFGNFSGTHVPQINASGQVAFHSYLDVGTTNQGVYRGDGTTLTAIAVTGMTAPGTTLPFDEMSFDSVRLNDQGRVAFRGRLLGASAATNRGLWAGTSMADLELIAREGDVFFVNGANRTLAEPSAFFELNDAGIAWRATFTDNTQAILYSTFTPVPEPATVFGLASVALALSAARRRWPG